MGNVLSDTLISLNLIEEVSTLRQLHRNPPPRVVFTRLEERDDIIVVADVFVHRRFHLQLSGADFAMPSGVLFVDELDGEDGVVCVRGGGFFDATLDN